MCEEMCEKVCEKIGEKRGEDKREPVTYRIYSLKQNAKDGVKQLKGKKRSYA
jgi:hypothetical protein